MWFDVISAEYMNFHTNDNCRAKIAISWRPISVMMQKNDEKKDEAMVKKDLETYKYSKNTNKGQYFL